MREVPEGFNGGALRDLAAEGQIQAVLMYSPDDEQCPQTADPPRLAGVSNIPLSDSPMPDPENIARGQVIGN